ncbi:hypothetical protein [Hydrocarboniphaga sp.]|uniref:hypothetical protein n=1 Tax=Hydrocarboniphaga sp. TaxID=2033016 RepID=UPI002ABA4723|nr:hypothetical protein [Hydrocarboniphaga sp.]MDZ4080939.1 hypothetical protein [Hydrocarboniphaga sp.]
MLGVDGGAGYDLNGRPDPGLEAARVRCRLAAREHWLQEPEQPWAGPIGIVCSNCPKSHLCCQAPHKPGARETALGIVRLIYGVEAAERAVEHDRMSADAWEAL